MKSSEPTSAGNELLLEWPAPGVCIMRMNRPHAYNALNRELVDAMREALAGIWDDGARVFVLAASDPGFCSGADLKQRKTMSDEEKYAHNRAINGLANEIAALPIPTMAMVNGIAMGGGCELALACDMRFASDKAVIGLTEARIGAMPGAGGSQRLPRLVGTAHALEIIFSGEPVAAERAREIGLVNAIHACDELEASVLAFATLVAGRSRETARKLKDAVYRGLEGPIEQGLEIERTAIVEVLASSDYKEGLAAFAEKRKPKFS